MDGPDPTIDPQIPRLVLELTADSTVTWRPPPTTPRISQPSPHQTPHPRIPPMSHVFCPIWG